MGGEVQPARQNLIMAAMAVASQDGGVEALDQVRSLYSPIEEKESKQSKQELQSNRVNNDICRNNKLKKVKSIGKYGTVYFLDEKIGVYQKLSDQERNDLVRDTFRKFYRYNPLAKDIESIGKTLEMNIDDTIDYIEDDIIKIGKDTYWSRDEGSLLDESLDDCFRALFSGLSKNMDRVQVDIDDIDTKFIREQFDDFYAHIEANDGYFVPLSLRDIKDKSAPGRTKGLALDIKDQPLNAFWVWANEDLDKFNDLLKAVAANFMRVKPKGAFILIGRTRNGKSSFIKMLHTLFGKRNTSSIKLTELEDSHMNMDLLGTMMNAPDEEDEGKGKEVLRAQALFKTITTHDPIKIPVLYSQDPQDVATDFMCYFPMNDTPQWQGSGAEACMRRSFILSFDADLSRFDNNARDFEKETYTADFYSRLLPLVLAFAKYYNEHPFKLSDTQKKNQQLINEEVDNVSVYLNEFQKYFPGGYASVGLIWDDYKCWCESRGLLWKGKQDFSRKLKVIGGKPSRLTVGNEVINITRIEKEGAVLHDNYIMWNHNGLSVKDLLYPGDGMKPRSVIEYLNTHANKKSKEELKEEEKARRAKESEEWGKEFWEKRKDDEDTLNAIKGLGW